MQAGKTVLKCDAKDCGYKMESSIGELSLITEDIICPKCGGMIAQLNDLKQQIEAGKAVLGLCSTMEEITKDSGIDNGPPIQMQINIEKNKRNKKKDTECNL